LLIKKGSQPLDQSFTLLRNEEIDLDQQKIRNCQTPPSGPEQAIQRRNKREILSHKIFLTPIILADMAQEAEGASGGAQNAKGTLRRLLRPRPNGPWRSDWLNLGDQVGCFRSPECCRHR